MRPTVYIGPLVVLALCGAAELLLFRVAAPLARFRRRVVLALCFVVPLAVYLYCLAPGLAGDDSAEYALQASRVGLAHAGGYPLYLLLGKLFTLPFGAHVALGMNVMSAVFSAMAVVLLALVILRTGCDDRLALYLGLQFAFVPAFWSQAVFAEVHNVNTAVGLGLILLLLTWRERGCGLRRGAAIGFLAGLATGVYFPGVLIAPALLLFAVAAPAASTRQRLGRAAACVGSFALALALVCVAIVLKARQEPPLGSLYPPVNVRNLYCALTGKEYGFAVSGVGELLRNWRDLLRHYSRSLLWVTFGAGLMGMVVMARRGAIALWLLLAGIVACNAFYIYARRPWTYPLMTNISYAAFAVWAAWGYEWLFAWRGAVPRVAQRMLFVVPAVALFAFHAGLVRGLPPEAAALDRSGERRFDAFADDVLASAPPCSLVVASWPYATAIRYKQAVHGLRPDIEAIEPRDGMWYGHVRVGSWREEVRRTYRRRPVFLAEPDPEVVTFAALTRSGPWLWRVVPRERCLPPKPFERP